jgi:hypothetical protein
MKRSGEEAKGVIRKGEGIGGAFASRAFGLAFVVVKPHDPPSPKASAVALGAIADKMAGQANPGRRAGKPAGFFFAGYGMRTGIDLRASRW